MALHWPTFFKRLASAVVFCIIMMAGLLGNEWSFAVLVSLIMVLCLREFFRLEKKINHTSRITYKLAGLVYIVLPCVLLILLYRINWILPLAIILMLWMNDTMAYLVGSFIGKTPFSKISPKKTIEGTAGGIILTIAGATVWGNYTDYYSMMDWLALAFIVSIAGTAGDLLESKLKRMAGVKDSGTMMPGHGGALDRFDSLLVATPFAFAYAYLFMA